MNANVVQISKFLEAYGCISYFKNLAGSIPVSDI